MSYNSASGNYPLGAAYDSNAPYNQVDEPEQDYDVKVEYVITKETTVSAVSEDALDGEIEGKVISPLELIRELKIRLEKEYSASPTRHLKRMIKECDGWEQDDFYYQTYSV